MRKQDGQALWRLAASAVVSFVVLINEGVAADVTPPTLESWNQYPDEINVTDGPGKVYVEFRVTDDETGIEEPNISASSKTTSQSSGFGSISVLSSSNGGLDVLYRGEIVIRQGAAPGPWEITLFPLRDNQGNEESGFGPKGYDSTFTVIEDEVEEESALRIRLEEPADGFVHMGVGNLRGWAVSSVGIRKVEAYLDGDLLAQVPYGGTRGDVGNAYPDIDGSGLSGFSMAFNYSGIGAGAHTLEVVAHSVDNKTISKQVEFQTVRFNAPFIGANETVDLNMAASVLSGNEIRLENISIAGKSYNLLLRWRTSEQGFEIVELEPLD